MRGKPEQEEADGSTCEPDQAGPVRLALEELVGRPTGQQGSHDASYQL